VVRVADELIIGAMVPGTSDRSFWPTRVNANRPSRRCFSIDELASARISRNVAPGSEPTRRATSSARNGPSASASGMPSLVATYNA